MDWRFVASLIQLDALRMQSPWRYGTCGIPPRMPATLGPPRLSSYPSSLGLFPLLQLPPPSSGGANPAIDGSGISGAFHPKPHSITSPTTLVSPAGPAEMLFSLRDLEQKSTSSSSSSSSAVHLIKKPGRWCAAHVRIAWEIHLNQQIQPPQRHSQSTSSESSVKNNGQQRRSSLGSSPWTNPSGAGASSSSSAGGLLGGPGPLQGLDNGFRPTTPSTPSTGIAESVSAAVAGGAPSRPTSRPPTLPQGPLQSPSLFNFSSLLGPLNERSFAAQLEAIYKYGSVASPFIGLSPFRNSLLGGLTGPTSGLFGGLDGYLGGGGGIGGVGGGGLFSPGPGCFSLSPGGSVGPTSASSELSRLGRTAVASSFGGSRPWLDQGAEDKDRLDNETKERNSAGTHRCEDARSTDNCHRNHKHSRDRDASTNRRSSTSDRPISRDSSSHESNSSPAVGKTPLDRDRSRSPVSRNRPDSTVKLLGTNNRQNTEYQQQQQQHQGSGVGFGGSRGQSAVDRRNESGSPPAPPLPLPPTAAPLVREEWEKIPPPVGLRVNPDSLRDFYRRDPMAMVDPVLVGLYSGLAGLTGQSFLGPFGIYGGGGGRGSHDPSQEREAGEATTRYGSESPVNRTKLDSSGSSGAVRGERPSLSEKKRKEHKDSRKCSPSKKHSASAVDALGGGRLFHTPPDCSVSALVDHHHGSTKTPLQVASDEGDVGLNASSKGSHSPSSTVETSSASTPPSSDSKTTGNNNNNTAAAILNPLLPPYPTEAGPGCSAASSGNVTPDSSSCDPQQQQLQQLSEKSVMELEGSSSISHSIVSQQQHLQEEC